MSNDKIKRTKDLKFSSTTYSEKTPKNTAPPPPPTAIQMSNNKQSMKLYKGIEVRSILEKVFFTNMEFKNIDEVLEQLTPIEILSDEDIKKMAIERFPIYMEVFGSEKIDGNKYFRSIFIEGIECLRDKIQGDNK